MLSGWGPGREWRRGPGVPGCHPIYPPWSLPELVPGKIYTLKPDFILSTLTPRSGWQDIRQRSKNEKLCILTTSQQALQSFHLCQYAKAQTTDRPPWILFNLVDFHSAENSVYDDSSFNNNHTTSLSCLSSSHIHMTHMSSCVGLCTAVYWTHGIKSTSSAEQRIRSTFFTIYNSKPARMDWRMFLHWLWMNPTFDFYLTYFKTLERTPSPTAPRG